MFDYILRRTLQIISLIVIISVLSFAIIELPPGDYVTMRIVELEQTGTRVDEDEIARLTEQYGLDKTLVERYALWAWNIISRGHLGRSFQWEQPVTQVIGERIALTMSISLLTLIFIWVVAIPIGIYAATHQYSLGDYVVRTGWFECSEPQVNQLHQNIVWGMRGNFLDLPTDCPQRDERLGWTGDIQVFAPTATLLYDTAAGWGDAATVVPMTLGARYGDLELLRRQYPSMKACVEHVRSVCDERRVWGDGFQFGDWVDPKSPPDAPGDAQTDSSLVGTAWFARSAQLVAEYRLLPQTALPSWLYPITMGVTTIWERWDAMLPDGSINPGEMTSFNHYAYGAVGSWLYERMAGLRQYDAERGWRRFVVEPHPGGGIRHARAAVDTPYGRTESSWRIDHPANAPATFTLRAVVPANTTAALWLPGATSAVEVGSGEHELSLDLSEAQRRRYLPSREGARLHLDSPLADVLADQAARQVLVRHRAFGVLPHPGRRDTRTVATRSAAVDAAPARQQAARRPRTGPDPPVEARWHGST